MTTRREIDRSFVCPLSKIPLKECSRELLTSLNERIRAGEIRALCGTVIAAALEGALIREDGSVAYPIVRGIPVLLPDAAFHL